MVIKVFSCFYAWNESSRFAMRHQIESACTHDWTFSLTFDWAIRILVTSLRHNQPPRFFQPLRVKYIDDKPEIDRIMWKSK